MAEEIGEYDTPLNKARPVKPIVPDKCSSCEYESRCFWILKLFPSLCQQGRRKKTIRQTSLDEHTDPQEVIQI